MPLSRSHARQKSRSASQPTLPPPPSPHKPAFLPPSHYAAAAGISYQSPDIHPSAVSRQSSRAGTSPYMSPVPTLPSPYSNQYEPSISSVDTVQTPSTSHFNRVSRFISRSPSRSSSLSLRRSSSKGSKGEKEREREPDGDREQLRDIPLMEMQLLPSLRDTVDRMTHPPNASGDRDETGNRIAEFGSPSAYSESPVTPSRRRQNAAPPPPSLRTSRFQSSTPTANLTPTIPPVPRSSASPSIQNTPLSTPRINGTSKPALKSALRMQSPATPAISESASPRAPDRKSLRTTRPLVGKSPGTSHIPIPETPSHESRIPGSRSEPKRHRTRTGDAAAPSERFGSSIPLAKSVSKSNPNTPQAPLAFPGFATPQTRYPGAAAPAKASAASTPKPHSSIPRSSARRAAAGSNDSGSELERRVSRTFGTGRLVVANGTIVPSSSEDSQSSQEGARPWAAKGAAAQKTASGIPAPGRWREQLRREEPREPPWRAPARRDEPRKSPRAREERYERQERDKQPVGLGLRLAIGLGLEETRGRYDVASDEGEEASEAEASIKDVQMEMPLYESEDDFDDVPRVEESPPRRQSHHRSKDRWEERQDDGQRNQQALMGIVNGLTHDFTADARASALSRRESDDYYSQGLAITVSDSPGRRANTLLPQLSAVQEQRTLEEAILRDDDSMHSADHYGREHEEIRRVSDHWRDSRGDRMPRDTRQPAFPSPKVLSPPIGREERYRSRHDYFTQPSQPRNEHRLSPAPRSPAPERDARFSPLHGEPSHRSPAPRHSPFAGGERFVDLEPARPSHSSHHDRHRPSSRKVRSPYDDESSFGAAPVLARNDTDTREREAFGIPASLSYGARISPQNSMDFEGDGFGAGGAMRRSDSESSAGALSLADSERISDQRELWNEQPASGGLSKAAAALFDDLTIRGSRQKPRSADARKGGEEPSFLAYLRPSQPEATRAGSETAQYSLTEAPSQNSVTVTSCSSAPSIYEDPPAVERAESFDMASPGGSWHAMLQPGVHDVLLAHYGPVEMQRQELIHELLSSEQTFVRCLRTIVRTFFLPLRARDSRAWLPGVPPEVSKLFDWFEDILNLHKSIARTLESVLGSWYEGAIVENVADLLCPLVSKLEVYQPYLVRVQEVRELVAQYARDAQGEFGEYVRMCEKEGECAGRALEALLEEPVDRLLGYPVFFQRLLDVTPPYHPDYVATMSLLFSLRTIIHVMEEVRVREEEYDYVKHFAGRIEGLASCLPRRERRLLRHGFLQWSVPADDEGFTDTTNSLPPIGEAKIPLFEVDFLNKPPPPRVSRLTSAIQAWHGRRKQSGSLSSFASSTLSGRSYDTASSSTPSILITPSDEKPNQGYGRARFNPREDRLPGSKESRIQDQTAAVTVHAFVFNDLLVLTVPVSSSSVAASPDELWCLVDGVGLSRILGMTEDPGISGSDRLVSLDLLPATIEELESGVFSNTSMVHSISLVLPPLVEDPGGQWLSALEKCHQNMLRSLSFPSLVGNRPAHGTNLDLELDTRQSVFTILASGLPMPKSPSMHRIEVSDEATGDTAQQEREERGWWSLRFQQVFREVQRQDTPISVHRSGDLT